MAACSSSACSRSSRCAPSASCGPQYTAGDYASPTQVFAAGLVADARGISRPCRYAESIAYALLILAVSVVLPDLARHGDASGPLHVPGALGAPGIEMPETVTGCAKVLDQPLGRHDHHRRARRWPGHDGLSRSIWPLFGAANQLLAALASARRVRMARQCGQEQQDVLRAHGVHAHRDADVARASRSMPEGPGARGRCAALFGDRCCQLRHRACCSSCSPSCSR